MNITLLGTGTSQGVPVIGCDCVACTSSDPHDARLRSAALLQIDDVNILIDAGPDLRQQMLRAHVRHLDAILITHEHNDHVIGLDDVRPFNFRSGHPIRVYALPRVANEIRRRFDYVFGPSIPGLPRIELIEIMPDQPFAVGHVAVHPVEIMHGRLPIVGYRVGNLAYLTDVKYVSEVVRAQLRGIPYLITSALHHQPHPTHMNLVEALAFVADIGAGQTWFTHLSHQMGLARDVCKHLPDGVHLAYDGLQIEVERQLQGF